MVIDDYTVHIVDDEEAVRKSLAFLLTMSRLHRSCTSVRSGVSCCCADDPQWLPGYGLAHAGHERCGIAA